MGCCASIFDAGAAVPQRSIDQLHRAVEAGTAAEFRTALAAAAGRDTSRARNILHSAHPYIPSGGTLLHAAVYFDNADVVKHILWECDARLLRATDNDASTPLHVAVRHFSIASLLEIVKFFFPVVEVYDPEVVHLAPLLTTTAPGATSTGGRLGPPLGSCSSLPGDGSSVVSHIALAVPSDAQNRILGWVREGLCSVDRTASLALGLDGDVARAAVLLQPFLDRPRRGQLLCDTLRVVNASGLTVFAQLDAVPQTPQPAGLRYQQYHRVPGRLGRLGVRMTPGLHAAVTRVARSYINVLLGLAQKRRMQVSRLALAIFESQEVSLGYAVTGASCGAPSEAECEPCCSASIAANEVIRQSCGECDCGGLLVFYPALTLARTSRAASESAALEVLQKMIFPIEAAVAPLERCVVSRTEIGDICFHIGLSPQRLFQPMTVQLRAPRREMSMDVIEGIRTGLERLASTSHRSDSASQSIVSALGANPAFAISFGASNSGAAMGSPRGRPLKALTLGSGAPLSQSSGRPAANFSTSDPGVSAAVAVAGDIPTVVLDDARPTISRLDFAEVSALEELQPPIDSAAELEEGGLEGWIEDAEPVLPAARTDMYRPLDGDLSSNSSNDATPTATSAREAPTSVVPTKAGAGEALPKVAAPVGTAELINPMTSVGAPLVDPVSQVIVGTIGSPFINGFTVVGGVAKDTGGEPARISAPRLTSTALERVSALLTAPPVIIAAAANCLPAVVELVRIGGVGQLLQCDAGGSNVLHAAVRAMVEHGDADVLDYLCTTHDGVVAPLVHCTNNDGLRPGEVEVLFTPAVRSQAGSAAGDDFRLLLHTPRAAAVVDGTAGSPANGQSQELPGANGHGGFVAPAGPSQHSSRRVSLRSRDSSLFDGPVGSGSFDGRQTFDDPVQLRGMPPLTTRSASGIVTATNPFLVTAASRSTLLSSDTFDTDFGVAPAVNSTSQSLAVQWESQPKPAVSLPQSSRRATVTGAAPSVHDPSQWRPRTKAVDGLTDEQRRFLRVGPAPFALSERK